LIEGGHYRGACDSQSVLLNCLTIVGRRSHFGHFMLDFLWPLYHWLYMRGRLYDKDLTVYIKDQNIEAFRSIVNEFFHCKVVTKFTSSEANGCLRDMILGMEGHNRRVFKLGVKDYVGRPKEYIRHFQHYTFEKLGIEREKADKFLLVERKIVDEDRGGGRRTIENHRELEKGLSVLAEMKGLHFENVMLEDMSFTEQVKLFAEAQVVVGQHGAGLCHFLWMPEDAVLQEVHHTDKEAYRFGGFCNFFGRRHGNMVCPSTEKQNIVVPVNELMIGLDKTIGEYHEREDDEAEVSS